ncbi:phosphopantetheine-binding [Rivularia sp. IAM M-261]|nr:phosphopantetheine-binding [Rivularia sp. IAM M-261]
MEIQADKSTQTSEIANSTNAGKALQKKPLTKNEMQGWLISYLVELLEIEPSEVDVTISFNRYGLDSSTAIGLIGDLEQWLGYELDPTLMYDYPTIEALSEYLSQENNVKA